MKINTIIFVSFGLGVIMLFFMSCEKENNCHEENNSASGENESHNFGMNCMNCHTSGGEGEGCFIAAGSAVDSNLLSHLTGGMVKFYTEPNGAGTMKYSIPIDANGNFFSTESISVSGLFPSITGPSGLEYFMSSSPASGACNSCHGVSTNKLWAN
jgi:hypothetical protein